MIAYITAGAILGFYSIEVPLLLARTPRIVPLAANLLLAFAGGVGGHLVYTLIH